MKDFPNNLASINLRLVYCYHMCRYRYFIDFQVVKEIKTCLKYQKGIQSKVGLTGHRKTHHPDLQRNNLTDSSFIVK